MRLTAKLVTTIVLGIIALIAIDAFVSARRAVALYHHDMRRHAELIARLLRPVLEDECATNGFDHALRVLDNLRREDQLIRMRWVWLDGDDEGPFVPRLEGVDLTPVKQGQELSMVGRGTGGRDYLFFYTPLSAPGQPPAALELSESVTMIDTFAGSIRPLVTIERTLLIVVSGVRSLCSRSKTKCRLS